MLHILAMQCFGIVFHGTSCELLVVSLYTYLDLGKCVYQENTVAIGIFYAITTRECCLTILYHVLFNHLYI